MNTVKILMNVEGEDITITVKGGKPEHIEFIADYLSMGLDNLEKLAADSEANGVVNNELPN